MKTRKIVIGAALVIIGLPVVLVLIAAVSFYASFYSLNRSNGTIVSSGQKREYLRGAVAGHPNGNKSMEQGGR